MPLPYKTEKLKVLGILGGMGPAATIYFMDKLLKLTPAEIDQDHIPTITYNNTQVPDRSEAYLREGKSPVNELIRSARILEDAGSSIIVIPCNSAHIWYREIANSVNIEVLNMPEIAIKDIPVVATVGIISTTSVRISGLYSSVLEKRGNKVELPEDQEKIMKAIYLVKAGKLSDAKKLFVEQIREMEKRDIEYLIEGCTEVPLAINQEDTSANLVDTMEKLAIECVRRFEKNKINQTTKN